MREFTLRQRMLPAFERGALLSLFWAAVATVTALAAARPFWVRWEELHAYGEALDWTTAIGKGCGGAAATLLLVQALLGARSRWVDRFFGLDVVYRIHRTLALVILLLATLHPMFVQFYRPFSESLLAADWPLVLGSLVLGGFWIGVSLARFRRFIELPYHWWQQGHRLVAWTLLCLLFIHILTVSEDYRRFPGVVMALGGLGIVVVLALRTRLLKRFGFARTPYVVKEVSTPGPDAVELTLTPAAGSRGLEFVPGQFAFLLPESTALPAEEHPFTIASAPDALPELSFTIRCCGDFTNQIGKLVPGDSVLVDGPYGRFSYASLTPLSTPLLLVAGGVGVTPMLSMLRTLAHEQDPRALCLIWSTRTRDDLLHAAALKELEAALENLRIIHVFSRQRLSANLDERSGRLRPSILRDALAILPHTPQDPPPHAFLCGPAPMIALARGALLGLGMPARRIHAERFEL
ncbi:ferredoxin reductase family protein [Megalodesulfovibrio paquesii]